MIFIDLCMHLFMHVVWPWVFSPLVVRPWVVLLLVVWPFVAEPTAFLSETIYNALLLIRNHLLRFTSCTTHVLCFTFYTKPFTTLYILYETMDYALHPVKKPYNTLYILSYPFTKLYILYETMYYTLHPIINHLLRFAPIINHILCFTTYQTH